MSVLLEGENLNLLRQFSQPDTTSSKMASNLQRHVQQCRQRQASPPFHIQPPNLSPTRVDTPSIQVRQPAPARIVPTVSSIALKASDTHRETGNDHFKRGDYATAHQSYATSLSYLPDTHPLSIILLTNRALTALKTGEPKSAILDADKAITLIGPSKGEKRNRHNKRRNHETHA